MQYKLTTPVTRTDLEPLQAGDTVLVDGSEGALRLEIPPAAVQALNTKEEPT